MGYAIVSGYDRVKVVLERRPDGGLRVSSPDVPGFRLSNRDPAKVKADIEPALETIIGAHLGRPVRVRLASDFPILNDVPRTTIEYESKAA